MFQRGDLVTFAVKAPPTDPTAQIEWRSNRDGLLGEDAPLALQNLSPVMHQVIVFVDGAPQDTVRFTVQDRTVWNLQLLGMVAQGGAGIRVEDDLAVVTCGLASLCIRAGVSLFDITDPAAPQLVAIYEADDLNPRSAAVSGTTVFVSSVSSGSNAFVSTVGVRILDIADPVNPVVLADIESITEVAHVAVHEGFLYAANNIEGAIHVFDVDDPSDPRQVAEIRSPLGGRAFNVDVKDSRLYGVFLDPDILLLADVSNPRAPAMLGTTIVSDPLVAAPAEDGQFVLTPSGRDLLVWDVVNPMDVRLAATYRSQPGFDPIAVVVRDRRAYIAYGPNHGLEVLDLSDPSKPLMIAFHDPGGRFFPSDIGLTDAGSILALFADELRVLAPGF